jgi:hypothetical protein
MVLKEALKRNALETVIAYLARWKVTALEKPVSELVWVQQVLQHIIKKDSKALGTSGACARIQALYRSRRAKRYSKEVVHIVYRKEYDLATNKAFFVNNRSGETKWKLPRWGEMRIFDREWKERLQVAAIRKSEEEKVDKEKKKMQQRELIRIQRRNAARELKAEAKKTLQENLKTLLSMRKKDREEARQQYVKLQDDQLAEVEQTFLDCGIEEKRDNDKLASLQKMYAEKDKARCVNVKPYEDKLKECEDKFWRRKKPRET